MAELKVKLRPDSKAHILPNFSLLSSLSSLNLIGCIVFVFSLSGRVFIWLHNCASCDWGHCAWSLCCGFDCLWNPPKAWIIWIPENLTGAPREKKKPGVWRSLPSFPGCWGLPVEYGFFQQCEPPSFTKTKSFLIQVQAAHRFLNIVCSILWKILWVV